MANLYVKCPNILAGMYAQQKLRDTFGFQILTEGNIPHISDRFVVVSPPTHCPEYDEILQLDVNKWHRGIFWAEKHKDSCPDCHKCVEYQKDKPVICWSNPTYDIEGYEIYEKYHNWVDLFDALTLIKMTEIKSG